MITKPRRPGSRVKIHDHMGAPVMHRNLNLLRTEKPVVLKAWLATWNPCWIISSTVMAYRLFITGLHSICEVVITGKRGVLQLFPWFFGEPRTGRAWHQARYNFRLQTYQQPIANNWEFHCWAIESATVQLFCSENLKKMQLHVKTRTMGQWACITED